jgi:hypothetical protein
MTEEEEEKLARLNRLVANVDSDDQALQLLGFDTDIYYMLGHQGGVQFSNGVSSKHPQGIHLRNSHDHGAYP